MLLTFLQYNKPVNVIYPDGPQFMDPLLKEHITRFESLLPRLMAIDRHAIRQSLFRLKNHKPGNRSRQSAQRQLDLIEKAVARSIKKTDSRKARIPLPAYNRDLPIFKHKDEIVSSIKSNRVIVVSGDTGSGKTTQLPQFCIEAGRGLYGAIGCTQPRRIAVTSVARRLSDELGTTPGEPVGYKMRFKDKTGPDTIIKLMTDGILLAETQHDRFLRAYDTLIVDEAHERSLNIDFILGILKKLADTRKDLRVIVTSATIDTKKFSAAFGNAPVIEISGRMYPVDVQYQPPSKKGEDPHESTHIEMAVEAVSAIRKKRARGDILLFMPTEQDIRDTCAMIDAKPGRGGKTLPLFARLSAHEQQRIFKPDKNRKIIVATNVAETSITIPNIKYVIDTGLARISHYAPASRTTSLPVVPISKSSADQRKGRCGRVENGVCIRLYSKSDYESRAMFTPPEIVRANLAAVILRMIALDIGEVEKFPFIDPPAPKQIKDGYNLLLELGAITKKPAAKTFTLTPRGHIMSKMPIDPRLSRILIEATRQVCQPEILVIAAALSIRDPRERPLEKAQQADEVHARFNHPESDFMSLLNIWTQFQRVKREAQPTRRIKKFCQTNFLSFTRMREWQDIHDQLKRTLDESDVAKLKPHRQPGAGSNPRFPDEAYNAIHRCILSGFLSNIAIKEEKNIFNAARGKQVMIFPGSVLFKGAGKWVVSAEIVRTSRRFARTVANIDSAWLEEVGNEQCRRTYFDPHWSKSREEVVAYEQTRLFGLIIEPRRTVAYGKIDPEASFDLFVQGGLIGCRIKSMLPFMKHNRALIDRIKNIENRLRRSDLLISDNELTTIFQEKLPYTYSMRSLRRLIKKKGSDDFLKLNQKDLLLEEPDPESLARFPETLRLFGRPFECTYRFNPGEPGDGVTIHFPATMVATMPKKGLEWVVPGLLEEKITFLTNGLPRSFRKHLTPLPAAIKTIVTEIGQPRSGLITALSRFVGNRFNLVVPPDAWPVKSLPPHLRMRVAANDHDGTTVCTGREPEIFVDRRIEAYAQKYVHELKSLKKDHEIRDIRQWDFGDLPTARFLKGNSGAECITFPALTRNKRIGRIELRLFNTHNAAQAEHAEGVLALLAIHFTKALAYLKRQIRLNTELAGNADRFGGISKLADAVFRNIIRGHCKKDVRTKQAFDATAKIIAHVIPSESQQILAGISPVLKADHELRSTLLRLKRANRFNPGIQQFLNSIQKEFSDLLPENFLDLYDADRCRQLPRYLKAMNFRAERGAADPAKDTARSRQIEPYTRHLKALIQGLSPSVSHEKRDAVESFFWLIQEFKVSLFAQELGTPLPVSPEKLESELEKIQGMG